MCTLGLSPKYPGWCCRVWAAANLLLLCSVAFAPHPSCLSCGLFSHARDFESGLLNLLSTLCRTLYNVNHFTSQRRLASFGLNIGQITSLGSWRDSCGLRVFLARWEQQWDDTEVTLLSRNCHGSGPEAACVPVWLPVASSSGGGKISKCKKRGLLNKTNVAGELLRAEVSTL